MCCYFTVFTSSDPTPKFLINFSFNNIYLTCYPVVTKITIGVHIRWFFAELVITTAFVHLFEHYEPELLFSNDKRNAPNSLGLVLC